MTVRSSCHRAAIFFVAASASLFLSLPAQARPEAFRWVHPDPSAVTGFEASVRSLDGSPIQVLPVGVSTPDDLGIYRSSIEVGDGDKYISFRAIGAGGIRSNWSSPEALRTDDGGGGGFDPGTPPTATPGVEDRWDFTTSNPGSAVPWWIDTQANFSLQIQDSLFDVVELEGNRVLHSSSTATDIHSHVTGGDHVWSDYEVRGRLAIDNANASIGITSYSQFNSSAEYYRLGRRAGGPFMIEGRPNTLTCSPSASPVTPAPGAWYDFKFDVQDMGASNQVRAKIWREGTAEPSGYALDCVDSSSSRLRSGRIGVWSSGGGQKYWDDFEVVTANGSGDGGSTPPPAPPAAPVLISVEPVAP